MGFGTLKDPIFSPDRGQLIRRLGPILFLFAGLLALVVGQVMYLMIAHGNEFQIRSDMNRIRPEVTPARRGDIMDRHGRYLATDEPVYELVKKGTEWPAESALTGLADRLELPFDEVLRRIREAEPGDRLMELTERQHVWVRENQRDLPGLGVETPLRRVYHHPKVSAPVVGYTGEINAEELRRRRHEGLSQGAEVGKHGVERVYDSRLQGTEGLRWVETTARGESVRTLETPTPFDARSGEDLTLTVDIDLQEEIARSFGSDSAGGAVVMDIETGELLALYSHPTYNPNRIVGGDREYIRTLFEEEYTALYNRMVQSRFPPASTFKVIPYLTALMSDGYNSERTYECRGTWQLGNREFRCWQEHGHGEQTLDEALINSCNIYFYNLIRDLGYEPVLETAKDFGYEALTGIDFPGEARSRLSSPDLKQHFSPEPWVGGDEVNFVIGHGLSQITPIKQTQLLGGLLTGDYVRPHLRKGLDFDPVELEIPAGVRDRLRSTLAGVTDEGTGYWAQHDENYQRLDVDILGKTGTVQVRERDPRPESLLQDEEDEDRPAHSWFVSAAPSEDPEYVVVVFMEASGSATESAAPMARRTYRSMLELGYFSSAEEGRPQARVDAP